jgi:hypothetical protein
VNDAQRRWNPDQPRIPGGKHGGGEFTSLPGGSLRNWVRISGPDDISPGDTVYVPGDVSGRKSAFTLDVTEVKTLHSGTVLLSGTRGKADGRPVTGAPAHTASIHPDDVGKLRKKPAPAAAARPSRAHEDYVHRTREICRQAGLLPHSEPGS